ncbi:MAG TPA: ATP-binding cassette domain-containing protein, partial [Brachybacterium sp.]|nr:ATP-binding cassette domain-containing protein [Brachybacterium sp.]
MHRDHPSSAPVPAAPGVPDAAGSPSAPQPVPGPAAPVTAEAAIPDRTALSLRGMRKSFDRNEVVRGISLDVPRGSFYGIVGPNGAGKTTTLSMA